MDIQNTSTPTQNPEPVVSLGNNQSLPPIKSLFVDSWKTFTRSILNLFLLYIILLVLWGLIILVSVGITLILGGGWPTLQSFSNFKPETLSAIPPLFWITAFSAILLFIFLFLIIGLAIQIAQVLVVNEEGKRTSLGEIISQSIGLVFPLFLTKLLLSFFSVGGFFVFILPAILLSFFFIFAPYEVVLGRKRFLGAIKGSYQIVIQHFGDIFVRYLLYFLASFVIFFCFLFIGFITNFMIIIVPPVGSIMSFMMTLIRSIITILFGWFGLCFLVTLYKQAKAVTDFEKKPSFAWVWIVTIFGWILALLIGILCCLVLVSLAKSGALQKNLQTIQKKEESKQPLTPKEIRPSLPPLPSSSPSPALPALPSCAQYTIREGEFTSDKCYNQKDYDDLIYYLQRFNSAVFSYNGAVASMNITCSGSDFFKDACERDKQQKSKAEEEMNSYREIIKGIIAKGK